MKPQYTLTKAQVTKLLCRLIDSENHARTPVMRKYWNKHIRQLRKLAQQTGWID